MQRGTLHVPRGGKKGEFQENFSGFELALIDILKSFLVME